VNGNVGENHVFENIQPPCGSSGRRMRIAQQSVVLQLRQKASFIVCHGSCTAATAGRTRRASRCSRYPHVPSNRRPGGTQRILALRSLAADDGRERRVTIVVGVLPAALQVPEPVAASRAVRLAGSVLLLARPVGAAASHGSCAARRDAIVAFASHPWRPTSSHRPCEFDCS